MDINQAYRDLKLESVEINSLEDLDQEVRRVKASWRQLSRDFHPDSGRVAGSNVIAQRVNNAYSELKKHFEVLESSLSEKIQEIKQPRGIRVEPPFEPAEAKPWQPQEFEKPESEIKKAHQKYQENSEGFNPGMFNKVA